MYPPLRAIIIGSVVGADSICPRDFAYFIGSMWVPKRSAEVPLGCIPDALCRHLRFVTACVFNVGMVVKLAGSASGG